LFRITPTRTFSAVLVWLRASERISVSVLGIQTGNVIPAWSEGPGFRCAIGMNCSIPALTNTPPTPRSRPGQRVKAKSDTRSCRPLAACELNVRHDHFGAIISGANPTPHGAAANVG
jgi:hypothetical protein